MYTGLRVTKYVINYCTLMDNPISDLQLQKVLYYIQLNFIRHFHCRAFDDDFQAWERGPVVPEVYEEYRGYGAAPICLMYKNADVIFTRQERELTDIVINKCMALNPWELVRKSSNADSPWRRIYNGNQRNVIPRQLIEEYAKR